MNQQQEANNTTGKTGGIRQSIQEDSSSTGGRYCAVEHLCMIASVFMVIHKNGWPSFMDKLRIIFSE